MERRVRSQLATDTEPPSRPPADDRPPASSRKTRGRTGQIRDAIEQDILTGSGAAGERLDEQALAKRFAVSRTPVREALQQLASVGLIELIPNRGAFVRRISIRELVQMFEVMAELEGMAGRLAARRISPGSLADLRLYLQGCEEAAHEGDTDAYYAENERFHATIYDACGNDFLAGEARRLQLRLKAYRRLQLRVPRRMESSLAEHRRIVEAIESGDAARAQAELQGHITIQGERFADFVASLEARDAAE